MPTNNRPDNAPVDLRSDTVTRPTPGMLKAMMDAQVGDDVLGDDPTVIRLQERFAALLGKPAACFVPSGTMANQTAIRAQCEQGDEIICHADSHIINYETGGPAALSGVMIRALSGPQGQFDLAEFESGVRPDSVHAPHSRMLLIENTQNRGGGSIWPLEKLTSITARAAQLGYRRHLDGARLWNACAATGIAPAEYAKHFDTISCCFSKGLGTPVGSAVAGEVDTIKRVHRFRKMFGGAMRQAGFLAAAALYALDNHRDRLVEDHALAQRFAQGVAEVPGLTLDRDQQRHGVATNIVFFDLAPDLGFDAQELCRRLKSHGVLMMAPAPRRVRVVTHLDVTAQGIDTALRAIEAAVGAPLRA